MPNGRIYMVTILETERASNAVVHGCCWEPLIGGLVSRRPSSLGRRGVAISFLRDPVNARKSPMTPLLPLPRVGSMFSRCSNCARDLLSQELHSAVGYNF